MLWHFNPQCKYEKHFGYVEFGRYLWGLPGTWPGWTQTQLAASSACKRNRLSSLGWILLGRHFPQLQIPNRILQVETVHRIYMGLKLISSISRVCCHWLPRLNSTCIVLELMGNGYWVFSLYFLPLKPQWPNAPGGVDLRLQDHTSYSAASTTSCAHRWWACIGGKPSWPTEIDWARDISTSFTVDFFGWESLGVICFFPCLSMRWCSYMFSIPTHLCLGVAQTSPQSDADWSGTRDRFYGF